MSMGTQYRFSIDDTNRDGAPVPDVFVVGDNAYKADAFLAYLCQVSRDFDAAVSKSRESYGSITAMRATDKIYKDIAQWYRENRNGTVADLIDEWGLTKNATYTVTVHFDDIDQPLVITGVEAEDEDEAKEQVENGITANYTYDYSGPGDIDEDPFGDGTIYINYVEVEEEED